MKLETRSERLARARSKARRKGARHSATVGGVAVGVAIGAFAALALLDWSELPRVEELARSARAPLRFALLRATADAPPTLVIDQKFKHLHRLHVQRDRARTRGYVETDDRHFVPAVVSMDGNASSVRVQLWGPDTRALAEEAWPLLVEAKDAEAPFGMHRFSLVPAAGASERPMPLFLRHARDHGLPAARHAFVTLVWNGEERGVYELNELPSVRQMRAAHRDVAAIVAWNPSEHFAASSAEAGPWDDAFTAPLALAPPAAATGSAKRRARTALALLRGFQSGQLGVAEVFDLRNTAELLALAELWRVPEVFDWTRVRLGYDPISGRLSPIAYAAALPHSAATSEGMQPASASADTALEIVRSNLARIWLEDTELRRHFEDALTRFASEVATSKRALWKTRIEALTSHHHFASPWSRAPSLRALTTRANRLVHPRNGRLASPRPVPTPSPRRPVIAWDQRDASSGRVELAAPGSEDLRITTLGTGEGQSWAPLILGEGGDFPIRLRASPAGRPRALERIRYRLPTARRGAVIRGRARPAGAERDLSFIVAAGPRGLSTAILDGPPLDDTLERNPFVVREPSALGGERLRIPAGNWDVRGNLTPPAGTRLVIDAGARLHFEPGRGLLVRGPLEVAGTRANEVILEGVATLDADGDAARGRWAGVAVISPTATVRLAHLRIRDAEGIERDHWESRSALLVRAPRLDGQALRIEMSGADFALTLDRCGAALSDLRIESASLHAVRARQARVAVDGMTIQRAAGRGWWQSGGQSSLRAASFFETGDAATELDRSAKLEAKRLTIEGAALGLVARDGATATIDGGRVVAARHAALLAFGPLPGWGPSEVTAASLRIRESGAEAIVGRGSRVRLDGRSVEPADVDFTELRRGP